MKQRIVSLSAVLLLFCTAGIVRADEISDLKDQLKAQSEILKVLQQKIADIEARQKAEEQSLVKKVRDLEARQKVKEEALNTKMDELVRQAAKIEALRLPTSADWTNRIKWSGDFRYRHESINEETAGSVRWKDGRNRNRFRVRLMLEAIVNDEWDVAFRLSSGDPDTPTSTNQTMDSSFSSKDIWLDLAYFDYHPASVEGLNVFGGKIRNPFYRAGKNQLIFDSDVNPEGIAVVLERPLNDRDTIRLTGGGFWVDENSGSGGDPSLFGVQALIKHQIGNPDTVIVGASYYDYGNIKGYRNLPGTWGSSTSFLGNSNAGGVYTQDYDIFEGFGEYQTKCGATPVSAFGSWVQNTAATSGKDTGWLIGGTFNKVKDPGSWQLSYSYRDLEADAVLGQFSDSDFIGGGTDGKGHVFGFAYQVKKNVQAALTYFLAQDRANTDGRDFNYQRLQADLKFKFK